MVDTIQLSFPFGICPVLTYLSWKGCWKFVLFPKGRADLVYVRMIYDGVGVGEGVGSVPCSLEGPVYLFPYGENPVCYWL